MYFMDQGLIFGSSASKFVQQLAKLYSSLGPWAENIILFTAFATMFSTTLTCLDAFPKSYKKMLSTNGIKKSKKITENTLLFFCFYWNHYYNSIFRITHEISY